MKASLLGLLCVSTSKWSTRTRGAAGQTKPIQKNLRIFVYIVAGLLGKLANFQGSMISKVGPAKRRCAMILDQKRYMAEASHSALKRS